MRRFSDFGRDRFALLANAFWLADVRDLAAGARYFYGGIFRRREGWGEHLQFGAHAGWATSTDWIFFADCADFVAGLRIYLDGTHWNGSHAGIWAEISDEFQGYAFATGVTV